MVRFIKGRVIHTVMIVKGGEISFPLAPAEILTAVAFLNCRHEGSAE